MFAVSSFVVQNTEVAPVAPAEVLSAGPELRVLLRLLQAGKKRGTYCSTVYRTSLMQA